MTELKHILPEVAKVLNSLKKEGLIRSYALIGGMALAARGFPRATKDLDFLINTQEDLFKKKIPLRLHKFGYVVKLHKGDFGDPIKAIIRILDKDLTPLVDLILANWKWQVEMINAAEKLSFKGIPIPILEAEDLVVLKLKAGGLRDLLDAEELIKVVSLSGELDKKKLLLLAKRVGVDKKLKKLLLNLKIPFQMNK